MTLTDSEILNRAADIIDYCGAHAGEEWPGADRGASWRPGDPCCILGAISLVTGKFPDGNLVVKLREALGAAVSSWSDAHYQAEIVATLRSIAAEQ